MGAVKYGPFKSNAMNKFVETQLIISSIRKQTDTAVLFYSAGGKDSIVLLDMLSKKFNKVICYFMYTVPNMEHINVYIKWAITKYRNVEVRQIPHFQLFYLKKFGLFCDPVEIPKANYAIKDVEQAVRDDSGQHFAFNGMKGVDGFRRRLQLNKYRPKNYTTEKGMVYPLAMWKTGEVMQYIKKNGLIQPMKYGIGGPSNGFAFTLPVFLYLEKHYPQDLEVIYTHFPYARKILWDYYNKPELSKD